MADAVFADALIPRKPVVSAADDDQSIPLTLVVSDRETIAELLQRSDGRERDEYALAALRIGILSLKHARGQIDADAVRREGEKLLKDLKSALDGSRNDIHTNLTNALKEYFDPNNGRFQERIERLIKQDGELENVLQRQVGGNGSVLADTFRAGLVTQFRVATSASSQQQSSVASPSGFHGSRSFILMYCFASARHPVQPIGSVMRQAKPTTRAATSLRQIRGSARTIGMHSRIAALLRHTSKVCCVASVHRRKAWLCTSTRTAE
jgi:hypothetical protein